MPVSERGGAVMRISKRIILILVCVLMLIFGAGCAESGAGQVDEDIDMCIVNGRKMYFLADKEKKKLRKPLEKLLSNETHEIYADTPRGEIIGYEPYDKDEPTVPEGYACGLYDVTKDGIPELLVLPRGYNGSSGALTYYIYDLESYECIGTIDSGNAGSWCVYYFVELDELRSVGSYWRRGGWQERYRVMTFLTYDERQRAYGEESFLYAWLGIDGERVEEGEVLDGVYIANWVESYPYAYYKVRGKDAYLDEYYAELDWFNASFVRIPETELQMISWGDVCDDDDDRFERAEKMVDALLSTTQEFILP